MTGGLKWIVWNQVIKMVKMVIGKTVYHIFSVYAPQVGRSEDEKAEFWKGLEDKVVGVPRLEGLFVAGDLNGHIGSNRDRYEDVMGHFGFGGQNVEGEGGTVLDFCRNHQLQILNTYFKKDREKYITYKSGGAETQIDLILMKKVSGVSVTDCKAIPGEACLTQHRLVCAAFRFSESKKKKWKGMRKITIWKIKDRETRDLFEERLNQKIAISGDGEWKNLEEDILIR